jgi:gluconate 2-dehydrogenase alpha chain
VLRVNLDDSTRRATAVTYMTPQGDTIDQPADLVILATFAYNHSRLFILSGIGKQYDPRTGEGTVGKNLAYQNMSTIWTYFDVGKNTNPFIGAGGNAVAVDDFNGDHYDHAPLGFVGGSPTWCNQAGNEPISGIPVPDGMPSWGKGWKKAVKDHYINTVSFDVHGTNMAYRDCYLDLDPDYRDQYGQSLLRFTFDWKDNDIKMIRYVTNEMLSVARAMNPKSIQVVGKNFGDHFDTRPCQTTHLAGGTIMGKDRNSSVLNRYLQSWDVHNLFALGSDDLAGNPLLQTEDATSAINIVLSGSTLPATKTAPSAITMAPYDWVLTDQDVADVVSFIQTSWGNRAPAQPAAKSRRCASP